MTHPWAPIAREPRTVPWPWTLLEALLGAGAVGILIGAFPLGLAGTAIGFAVLLIALIVVDGTVRTRYAGIGLERSLPQLIVLGFLVLLVVVLLSVLPDIRTPVESAAVVVGAAVLLFGVLRWDQARQVARARALAAQRDQKPEDEQRLGPRD